MSKSQVYLKWSDIGVLCRQVIKGIIPLYQRGTNVVKVYGVPRGGIYAALALIAEAAHPKHSLPPFVMANDWKDATFLFDDIIDTGATMREYMQKTSKPFFGLVDKAAGAYENEYVVFPWEELRGETGPQHNVVRMLEYIGEDPTREGLKETPERVVRSWDELFSGYKVDNDGIAQILKTFQDGSTDQMVVVRDIEFYSNCEHHIQPFRGVAHIGYIPNGKIVGLSKLARLVEVFSRRLQVQERLTQQIAKALYDHLKPQGVGVVLEAEHFCMSCRGVRKSGAKTVTSYLKGVFRSGPVRAEFLNLVHNGK